MSFAFNWFYVSLKQINCCMNERWNMLWHNVFPHSCFVSISHPCKHFNPLILRLSLLIIKRKHICHSFSEIDLCKITKGSRKAVRLWTVILHSRSRWCHTRLPGSWGEGYKQQPGCCVKSPRWTQQRGRVCLRCKAIDNCYYLILFLV